MTVDSNIFAALKSLKAEQKIVSELVQSGQIVTQAYRQVNVAILVESQTFLEAKIIMFSKRIVKIVVAAGFRNL